MTVDHGDDLPALRRSDWERDGRGRSAERGAPTSRAEVAAQRIAAIVSAVSPGERLGTKEELRVREQPLPDYLAERHRLHAALVDAIAEHDNDAALRLIHEHNASVKPPP